MTDLTYMQIHETRRAREQMFAADARLALQEQPRRTAAAASIARLVYRLVNSLPEPLRWRLHGADYMDSRVSRTIAATVCRAFGHRWSVCVSGAPPHVGHLLICDSCVGMPNTEDLDWCVPGTRDRRDLAAVAAELDRLWWDAVVAHPYPRQGSAA